MNGYSSFVGQFACYVVVLCVEKKLNNFSFGRCGTDAVLEEDYQQRIQQLEEVRVVIAISNSHSSHNISNIKDRVWQHNYLIKHREESSIMMYSG